MSQLRLCGHGAADRMFQTDEEMRGRNEDAGVDGGFTFGTQRGWLSKSF